MTDKVFFTQADIDRQLASIYRQMALQKYIPDAIVGITRGGLVPAVYISHYFNVPLYTINVSFRDTMIQGGIEQLLGLLESGKKVLVVDDICDSGETLNFIHEKTSAVFDLNAIELRYAVLFHNEASKCSVLPDFIGVDINKAEKDIWVCFPWEQN